MAVKMEAVELPSHEIEKDAAAAPKDDEQAQRNAAKATGTAKGGRGKGKREQGNKESKKHLNGKVAKGGGKRNGKGDREPFLRSKGGAKGEEKGGPKGGGKGGKEGAKRGSAEPISMTIPKPKATSIKREPVKKPPPVAKPGAKPRMAAKEAEVSFVPPKPK